MFEDHIARDLVLECPENMKITKVLFAEYGFVDGDCKQGLSRKGKSCFFDASSLVFKHCNGKAKCSFPADQTFFGTDPCYGHGKDIGVEVLCE
jgi:hypothetical protein